MPTTSTNEGAATSTRKRRRVEFGETTEMTDSGSAAEGGSAAPPIKASPHANLLKSLGPRLEPMMGVLASQPKELQEAIISQSKEMLDLATTIMQREESFKRFTAPWVDPTTGQTHVNAQNQPRSFVPNSLRAKCPVKASSDYNDDDDIQSALRAAMTAWESAQDTMAGHARTIAQLEITKRKDSLNQKFFKLTTTFALGLVVEQLTENGGMTEGMKLSREQLVAKAAYDALQDSPRELFPALAFHDQAALSAAYSSKQAYNDAQIEGAMSAEDNEFLKGIVTNLHSWIPEITVQIWRREKKKDDRRKVNAELRKALKPKAQAAANEDVETALEAMSEKTLNSITSLARQEAAKAATAEIKRQKKSLRKKSSGGGENPTPRPSKSGSNAAASSKRSSRRSNKRPSPDSDDEGSPAKRSKGNGRRQKKKPSTKTSKKKPTSKGSGGNRGAAKGGGKRKGAARR